MTKTILGCVCGYSFAFGLVYLLGAFYSVDFDISKWSEWSRLCVALLGGLISLYGGMLGVMLTSKEQPND